MCVHESWKLLSLRNESQKAAHEMTPFILNALTQIHSDGDGKQISVA